MSNNTNKQQQEDTKPALTRPSLLTDLRRDNDVPPPAARWNVNDASLRPVPPFYPPFNPKCTVYIGDATPSVVAVRIAECLRKRSVAVEFDEESHTATCMTMDRVHFTIHLYRCEMRSPGDPRPDFSHGVIVECVRTRGSVVSFHAHSRAILRAAMGLSDGSDTRTIVGPLEVPQYNSARPRLVHNNKRRATSGVLTGLENATSLLKKDRLDAQRLGLESLVMLTDEISSGKEVALYCSRAILGADSATTTDAQTWVVSLIQDRIAPGETVEVVPEHIPSSNVSVLEDSTVSSVESTPPALEDAHHGGVLRALAMRTFANALSVMSKYEGESLRCSLSDDSPLVSAPFLAALVEDLAGASRPPGSVAGTRLASCHEAALAAMCLGILAQHSEVAHKRLVPPNQEKQPVLDALEKARSAGQASNVMLARESERAWLILADDQESQAHGKS